MQLSLITPFFWGRVLDLGLRKSDRFLKQTTQNPRDSLDLEPGNRGFPESQN